MTNSGSKTAKKKYVSNKKVPIKRGSVKFSSHQFSKNWSKKNKVTPADVTISSHYKYWFDCPDCEHEFETSPNYLKKKAKYCPYCNNAKLCQNCDICFEKSFAYEEKSLYMLEENNIHPTEIFIATNKKYKFGCPECKHTFDTSPDYIRCGNFCPYCGNNKLCDDKDCHFCFEKSFASSKYAKYWLEENGISPRNVFRTTNKKYKFKCPASEHIFESSPAYISSGNFCSYCGKKKICQNCNICFERSFAFNEKSLYWSKKNKVSPTEVFMTSNNKFLFDCPDCGHEFESRPRILSMKNFCAYCCTPPQKLCINDDCDHCFNNSFAPHPYAKNWSKKNKLIPRQVFRGTRKKYYFDCPLCKHTFQKRPNHIINNSYCPFCVNKTEKMLYQYLRKKYRVTHNKRFSWCKDVNYLPFDFCILKYKILIELDGPQHFKQVSNWKDYKKTQKRDIYKMKRANKHGYSVVRILQEDVLSNKNDWKNKLNSAINQILGKKDVMNIRIGDIYEDHPIYTF